ncbi:hypothetical protein GGI04_001320 [Coemansia thaxteri]|nr:hypothetical protein GGI04_001320 [Coemansia thaxteri]
MSRQNQPVQSQRNGFYTAAGERRDRRSSDYTMNIDSTTAGDMSVYGQQQAAQVGQIPPTDYQSYSTTTAQLVDPWSFNHANLISNLSQLPADLLPSLIPQVPMNQMQYLGNSHMTAQNISAALAAASMTAARQAVPGEHGFAMPALPVHRQQQHFYGVQRESLQFQSQPISQFPTLPRQTIPQQQPVQQQGMYYNSGSTLQPLMVPPPSPTILSYYTGDAARWMSLLGQHAYQPQAYHYDYPVPPHQLPFNFPVPQQQCHYPASGIGVAGASVGSGGVGLPSQPMLLTQQYAPPPQPPPPMAMQTVNATVTLPSIEHALQQGNMAAAVAAQIAAVAAATGQYPQAAQAPPSGMAFPISRQLDGYGQQATLQLAAPAAGSGNNVAMLQQQQQQLASYGMTDFGTHPFLTLPAAGLQGPGSSVLGGATIMPAYPQQPQQQQALLEAQTHQLGSTTGGFYAASAFNSMGGVHAAMADGSRRVGRGAEDSRSKAIGEASGGAGSNAFVAGTRFTRQQAMAGSVRDAILQSAHKLYASNPRSSVLAEMLLSLHQLHPRHLPTLLLLACACFSNGQAGKSLEYNELILQIDPNYVEAMSNIGTTLRSMGKASEAEAWWWRAVRLRPGYWDAVENLMGVLCSARGPRYGEALQLCEFVDGSLRTGDEASRGGTGTVATYQVADAQRARLQSLLYSEGNLRFALGDVAGARRDYERAVEAVLGGLRLDELVRGVGKCAAQIRDQVGGDPAVDLPLLAPDAAARVLAALFPATQGELPGLAGLGGSALRQAKHVASNLLLQLAKLHQDQAITEQPLAVVLPLYYVALALEASPSTCNNLGIILSAIPTPPTATLVPSLQGGPQAAQAPMGAALALQYYTHGLALDARHPHLYTNLGSLLKDLGYVAEAVRMYEKAVECNPAFDVALANLGNAIKDLGRVQESVAWYLRAVQASPNFVEAVCGLANAMAGVCDWRARDAAGPPPTDAAGEQIQAAIARGRITPCGWMDRVVEIADHQLRDGRRWGRGVLVAGGRPTPALAAFVDALRRVLPDGAGLAAFLRCAQAAVRDGRGAPWRRLARALRNEGGWAVRLAERVAAEAQRRRFWEGARDAASVRLPAGLAAPPVPTVLPFHTFTYPLDARAIRLISHRNALRLSHAALANHSIARPVAQAPNPGEALHVGYVSSDFNNHPLAHLMQSVFGMHDRRRFRVFCYATTARDGSEHRHTIERGADVFRDCAAWATARIAEQIARDGVHVLVNLNGYTKGARNEVFAARPAPVLVAFMGFAGTLGAGWCDYLVADPVVCPPWTVRCEVRAERRRRRGQEPRVREMEEVGANRRIKDAEAESEDKGEEAASDPDADSSIWDFGELDPEEDCGAWVYTERMLYMPHTYFVNDHRQGFREDDDLRAAAGSADALWRAEQAVRYRMRRSVFPQLSDDVFIFANFNQLYKIDPQLFRLWLRILERAPRAVIWLLRFPAAGEQHLRRVAVEWAGASVASRILFTDVAPKHVHIKRGCVADAFLDTPECNAHTTAVDILWSGTPVLTWPRHEHKLCSRVAASVVCATDCGPTMVVSSADAYVDRAVDWALSASHDYEYIQHAEQEEGGGSGSAAAESVRVCHGPVADLRRKLFLARDDSRLFDTARWTRNLERGLLEAWRRWTTGEDTSDDSEEQQEYPAAESRSDEWWSESHKLEWASRIERSVASAAANNRSVYAPPGRSIWVCDEDDGMPAQSWLREMAAW